MKRKFIYSIVGIIIIAVISVTYFFKAQKFQENPTPSSTIQFNNSGEGPQTPKNEAQTADGDSDEQKLKVIRWEDLYKLNYKTGKAPDSVKRLHNSKVKLPGYIVPLSDDLSKLKEFLLVPNAQACIHVPPPPPNLIVHVTLKKPIPIGQVSNPSWVEGTLFIETTKSAFGAASYRMDADSMKEYLY